MTTVAIYVGRNAVFTSLNQSQWTKSVASAAGFSEIPVIANVGIQGQSSSYVTWEYMLEFDTSSIGTQDVVTSVSLSIATYLKLTTGEFFSHQVRSYDFGATFELSDWVVPPTAYAALTSLGSKPHSIINATAGAFNVWSLSASSVVQNGKTRFVMGTDRMAAGTPPAYSTAQYDRFYGSQSAYVPYLTVVFTSSTNTIVGSFTANALASKTTTVSFNSQSSITATQAASFTLSAARTGFFVDASFRPADGSFTLNSAFATLVYLWPRGYVGGNQWTNPGNALADDSVFATAIPAVGSPVAGTWDFDSVNLPSDAIIKVIGWQTKLKQDAGSQITVTRGYYNGSTNILDQNTTLGTSAITYGYNLNNPTSVTVSDLNTPGRINFRLSASRSVDPTNTAYCDFVRLAITYVLNGKGGAFPLKAYVTRTSVAAFAVDASLGKTGQATFSLNAQLGSVRIGAFTISASIPGATNRLYPTSVLAGNSWATPENLYSGGYTSATPAIGVNVVGSWTLPSAQIATGSKINYWVAQEYSYQSGSTALYQWDLVKNGVSLATTGWVSLTSAPKWIYTSLSNPNLTPEDVNSGLTVRLSASLSATPASTINASQWGIYFRYTPPGNIRTFAFQANANLVGTPTKTFAVSAVVYQRSISTVTLNAARAVYSATIVPSSVVIGNGWTNPENIYTDDNLYASATPAVGAPVIGQWTLPSFNVPSDARVSKMVLSFRLYQTVASIVTFENTLLRNGVTELVKWQGTPQFTTETTWNTTLTAVNFTKITADDLNGNMTLRITASCTSTTASTLYIDSVQMYIIYTATTSLVSNAFSVAATKFRRMWFGKIYS